MSMKYVTAALLASSLLSAPAFAQSAQQPAASKAPAAQTMTQELGSWRTSKLVGLNVYNSNNEKIGDINELITVASGRVDYVVIGVGGVLGLGERNVSLPWNQVKFVMEPRPAGKASMSTVQKTTTGAGLTATTTTTITTVNRDFPNHAVINMTKDQLAALPEFNYLSDARSTTTRTSPAPAPVR